MMGDAVHLSILVPVRAEDATFAVDRLALRDTIDLGGAEIVVTDDGSAHEASVAMRGACEARGWRYHHLDTGDRPFSLARARNAGLSKARGQYVLFDDLDMVYPVDFAASLIAELRLLGDVPLSFLSLPVLYLSENSSREVKDAGSVDLFARNFVARMLFEDPRGADANEVIDHYTPASAILAMPTATAHAVGGYDEQFEGWGGEDRDFVFRLLAANDALPRPAEFSATRVGNLVDMHVLAGWRALFRLHGDYCARKGLYGFHLHHRAHDWRTDRKNIELAARKAKKLATPDRATTETHRALLRSTLFSAFSREEGSEPLAARRPAGTGRATARWRKLRRDPHAFFRDSSLPFSNALSRLFKRRKDVV